MIPTFSNIFESALIKFRSVDPPAEFERLLVSQNLQRGNTDHSQKCPSWTANNDQMIEETSPL
jgi:hypothetical protein